MQEQEVDNQDELLERKAIAEKVIDRLAYEDSVLIPLNKTGLGVGPRGTRNGFISQVYFEFSSSFRSDFAKYEHFADKITLMGRIHFRCLLGCLTHV